jgi:uncharacterized RDD family membrane protein YckC
MASTIHDTGIKHIAVFTPQNVQIQYEIAGLGERIIARAIDYLVQLMYGICAVYVLMGLLYTLNAPTYLVTILLLIPIFGYDLAMEVLLNGQSIGKKITRLQVMSEDGHSATLGQKLLRWLIFPIDAFLFFIIAILSITNTRYGQRLGDLAAGTVVVRRRFRDRFEDTIFVDIDEDYRVTYPQVVQLKDKDISIINEILNKSGQLNPTKSKSTIGRLFSGGSSSVYEERLARLSKKVATVLGIEVRQPHEDFLRLIIADYNFLTGQDNA